MDRLMIMLVIAGAIVIGLSAQAWVSWLEHQRRNKALDIIRMTLERGRDPPAAVYAELAQEARTSERPPWMEVILFTALAAGFLLAFAVIQTPGDERWRYLVIGVAMAVTAIGCLILAIMRSRRSRTPDDRG